ncbi:flagellar basal body-associated protein FliL [Pikeienuella piscinae]|uniref:Flagellar basal body-associated protein FliL n=1 Tax=Pikeienuella piscinae TaxID=2748098 RepID=A0A7L5BYH6_9RHOB|nr:flagellar basal body-associated FliL family protein [Pikeienuella piscinae]QIE56975.1 flagellar basal body-associated protein FliL [Pikeienuella piscinae]
MMKLLPALILGPIGLGLGLAGGQMLRPAAEPETEPRAEAGARAGEADAPDAAAAPVSPANASADYVKLDRQFVVPVITAERVDALIVISMAVEVAPGGSDAVFAQEPKLRDEFLRVLFIHAQSGGFSGAFTEPHVLDDLRAALTASARRLLGDTARGVLLTNIVRQDL